MKLGFHVGYWGSGPTPGALEAVRKAEELGFDSVWTAEAYGSDAFTPLAWWGASTSRIRLGTNIVQMSARTPTATAMSALTMDHLSGGRLILGLGASGPQVVEGWYGQPYPKPLARTREYVEIIRRVLRREEVDFQGEHYQMPFLGGTGLGKPLKSIVKPLRDDIPILLGAEGPKNVAMAAEIADGWLPIFFSPYRPDVFTESLAAKPDDFEIACAVTVVLADDVAAGLNMVKWYLAFYIGGMGAPEQNFHLNIVGRLGFADDAARVQKLFMEGRRDEAAAAVPNELADEISLVGPPSRIRERLEAWVKSPVTTLIAGTQDPAALKVLADALS